MAVFSAVAGLIAMFILVVGPRNFGEAIRHREPAPSARKSSRREALGVSSAPVRDTPDHIALAERLGFARAWCYDSPLLYHDPFVTLARAADRTRRIGLGIGVLVPRLRTPVATAAARRSLAALAPAGSRRQLGPVHRPLHPRPGPGAAVRPRTRRCGTFTRSSAGREAPHVEGGRPGWGRSRRLPRAVATCHYVSCRGPRARRSRGASATGP